MKPVTRHITTLGLVALIGVGTYLAYDLWKHEKEMPAGLIQANGRIEGDHITVAGKFAGKVAELLVHEGDSVTAGQPMIRLDDAQVNTRLQQAQEAVTALNARIQAEETALSILRKEVPLNIETAGAGVTYSRALLSKAQASEQQMRRDASRFRELARNGTVEQHRKEQADLAWTVSQREVTSANTALIQAEKKLSQARLGFERIQAKEQEIAALKAQREQAKAAVAEVQSILHDLTVTAPSSGIITTRITNIGEVVPAGSPLFDLVDMDQLYLKVYIPEVHIGKLRLGLHARIYTDAFPEEPFPATLRYIASRAEFTPKEVQTPDERVKLVYAVKLYLDQNPDHRLTPGLPADAVIRWKEDVPWTRPIW